MTDSPVVELHLLKAGFQMALVNEVGRLGISQAELGRRLSIPNPRVHTLLKGDPTKVKTDTWVEYLLQLGAVTALVDKDNSERPLTFLFRQPECNQLQL